MDVGRHSGAICRACARRILVREGRLIEHCQDFPTLGRSLRCVGSQSRAPEDWLVAQLPYGTPSRVGALG